MKYEFIFEDGINVNRKYSFRNQKYQKFRTNSEDKV